jgi:hypothetical protein
MAICYKQIRPIVNLNLSDSQSYADQMLSMSSKIYPDVLNRRESSLPHERLEAVAVNWYGVIDRSQGRG